MDVRQRNNVQVRGDGGSTLVFAHGFGCDQNMWRFMAPAFESRHRVVLYDLTGCGHSNRSAYDRGRHGSLHGHARDLIEVVEAVSDEPVIVIGHSVSAIIAMLATIAAPERFRAQVMVAPSPSYINDGDYVGGFSRADIDDLLETLESNYLGWSSAMAPAIMGAPGQPELSVELTNSFCRTDPDIARHFARVTFLSDHRADVPQSRPPALVLQCTDDLIAPRAVGDFMQRTLPDASLALIENVGHCPHMSAAAATTEAVEAFLRERFS